MSIPIALVEDDRTGLTARALTPSFTSCKRVANGTLSIRRNYVRIRRRMIGFKRGPKPVCFSDCGKLVLRGLMIGNLMQAKEIVQAARSSHPGLPPHALLQRMTYSEIIDGEMAMPSAALRAAVLEELQQTLERVRDSRRDGSTDAA